MNFKLFFCGLIAWATSMSLLAGPDTLSSSPLKNAVILIIRHAEKPDDGSGLSADGEKRAEAYVNYFKQFTVNQQPLRLAWLFAAADSKKSRRPWLTIEPTGHALGLPIDSRFKDKDFQELANEIRSQPHGPGILIVWHHEAIPALLRALGADPGRVLPNAKWPGDVFGWLIQLRYNEKGQLSEVKRIEEKLLPDDLK